MKSHDIRERIFQLLSRIFLNQLNLYLKVNFIFSILKLIFFPRAIVTRAAAKLTKETLALLVVLDVVEGTALEALPKMDQLLAKIPQKFHSLNEAINWA